MKARPTAEERVNLCYPVQVWPGVEGVCWQDAVRVAKEHAKAEVEAATVERTAQLTAHRACCGTEHDPANGKIHGYCVVCGVEWPCAFVGTPPKEDDVAALDKLLDSHARTEKAERERDEARARCAEAIANLLVLSEKSERMRDEARAEVERLLRSRDEAYTERNALVAALSKVFPASLEQHDEADASWDPEWRTIVAVDLPTGQATWHIHDREREMFAHLRPRVGYAWDGHTTAEKYARLAALAFGANGGGVARLREAATELLEVADLRGDSDLPHPANDPLEWTARMQEAWDNLRAALVPEAKEKKDET